MKSFRLPICCLLPLPAETICLPVQLTGTPFSFFVPHSYV